MQRANLLVSYGFHPANCVLCGLATGRAIDLCEVCEQALPWNLNACAGCGLPQQAASARLCPQCQREPRAFDGVCAPFLYDETIAKLLSKAKFHAGFTALSIVSELCLSALRTQSIQPDVLIPVPLSWRRLAKRGFNQSTLIARHFGRALGIPVDRGVLKRRRHTRPQSELSRSARLKNLAGAFEVRKDLHGKSVALVDDVLTTGATAIAASRALKRAGAERVVVWVCARTPAE